MTMSHDQTTATAVQRRPFQFHLASLMLIVALAAIPLGLARQAVVLGILFAAATLPALARTWKAVGLRRLSGRQTATFGMVKVFLSSLAIIALIAVASLAMLLNFLLAAILLAVIAATSWCRVSAVRLARFCRMFRWLLSHVMCATAYLVAARRRPRRRFFSKLVRIPSVIGRMLGACIGAWLTAGLFLVVAVISLTRFVAAQLERLCDLARQLLKGVKWGLRCCGTTNGQLLRRFGAIQQS